MASDPQRVAATRGWLVKATEDLRASRALLELTEPLEALAGYHAQQAAEKALKGFLTWHDVVFRKTHDIEELVLQCATVDASLPAAIGHEALELSPLSWQSRYPDEAGGTEASEMVAAARVAQRVFDEVVVRLAPEVAP